MHPGEYPCQLIQLIDYHITRSVSATQDRERHENGLDTSPNAVSIQHLSVDGQQTRTRMQTDAKNCENHPEHQNDQNVGQDTRECGQPTPPLKLPLPLSLSRDVGVQKTSKQEHRANAKTARSSTIDPRYGNIDG